MSNTDLLTGIIKAGDENIVFTTIENEFDFMLLSGLVFSFEQPQQLINIPIYNGYLYGKTHSHKNIAIYVGNNSITMRGNRRVLTGAFFISKHYDNDEHFGEFNAIRFEGGTLNKLFSPESIQTTHDEESGVDRLDSFDDSIQHTINIDSENIKIKIYSKINYIENSSGVSINNNTVVLEMTFEKSHPFENAITHYQKIHDMLSFITYRQNIEFDAINLLKQNANSTDLIEFAELHINVKNVVFSKRNTKCISFDMVRDKIPNILQFFYEHQDNKHSYILGFIPENDSDVYLFTPSRIKEICSALDCETSYLNINNNQDSTSLTKLIDSVKKVLKNLKRITMI